MRGKFFQFIIYILEIILFITITMTFVEYIKENTFMGWTKSIFSYNFLEIASTLFVVYQIFVFGTLTLSDSSKRDAILSDIKIIKLAIVRKNFGVDFTDELNKAVKIYNREEVMFYPENIKFIKEIKNIHDVFVDNKISKEEYGFYLENKLVELEHNYEHYSLSWRLSFLLRFLK